MSVEIQATIDKSITDSGTYRVGIAIVSAIGIDLDVLAFTVEGQFSHVCTVYDMETWATSQEAAQTANQTFYRQRTAVVFFRKLPDAINFIKVTKARLKQLAVDWNSVTENFSGSDWFVTTSSPSTES